ELSVRTELENSVSECSKGVDVAQTVRGHACVQLRFIGRSADRRANRAHDLSLGVEAHDVIAVAVPGTKKSSIRRGHCIVKTRAFAVLKFAPRLSGFALIARDRAALHHI